MIKNGLLALLITCIGLVFADATAADKAAPQIDVTKLPPPAEKRTLPLPRILNQYLSSPA